MFVASSSIKEFVELTEQPWAFPSPGTWEPHPHQITTMAAMTSGLMGFDQGGNQADIFPGDDLPEDDEETCFLYFPV